MLVCVGTCVNLDMQKGKNLKNEGGITFKYM